MGTITFWLLLAAILGTPFLGSDDDDPADSSDADTDELPDVTDAPDVADDPDLPDIMRDTGASFAETDTGVALEIGDDETGSLAVIYYQNTEDTGDPDTFLTVDEARFYLVPEGVDWSDVNWENRSEIPGLDAFDGFSSEYELDDFEATFGLELLGTVDLLGVPEEDDPADRVGDITANAPVPGWFLEANTDGDELISFLPEDFVITRNGVPEVAVTDDTIGTDETDWLTAISSGITVDGLGGDDIMTATGSNVTLIGGLGDDTIETPLADDAVILGGEGNDSVVAESGLVDLGAGEDTASITRGTVVGGAGDDEIRSSGEGAAALFGEAGDDEIVTIGINKEAYGGAGNDSIETYAGGLGFGGEGDDTMRFDPGSAANGEGGDDVLSVYNSFADDVDPATLSGGDGADTIEANILNFGGLGEGVFAVVTDFDPTEDVLVVGSDGIGDTEGPAQIDTVSLVEASDGSFTDVQLDYTWILTGEPGSAVVRLSGVTGLTLDQIVVAG